MRDAVGKARYEAQALPGRLDQFWTARLAAEGVSRAKVQEWIKGGLARVDDAVCRRPSCRLRGGERLIVEVPEAGNGARPEEGAVAVVYRDESLLVVDKPPGLTVHPAPSCPEGTLVNRLVGRFPELTRLEGQRPGIVHRIDKDTSGLLVVALNEGVRLKLSEDFAERRVAKTYLALVYGRPEKVSGEIDLPIGRDPDHKTRMAVVRGGREAHTAYRVVWTAPDGRASLLEVTIGTGRTHQIRVHLSHEGYPLLGDALYGPEKHAALRRERPELARLAGRQMLHAWRIGFRHPATGREMAFTRGVPKDFWRLVLALGRSVQRVGVVGLPGCGKSAVLADLAGKGLPVWSADAVVAELYRPGADGWHLLRGRFGERFVPDAGRGVDKKALFAAMRKSEGFRRELMEMLYPLVRHRLEAFWREQARARVAFAEVPMLLEAGWPGQGAADLVLGVRCPEAMRQARLVGRGWSPDIIALMDSWQWAEEKKMAACSLTVDNASDLAALGKALDTALAGLRRRRVQALLALLAWLRGQGYAASGRG